MPVGALGQTALNPRRLLRPKPYVVSSLVKALATEPTKSGLGFGVSAFGGEIWIRAILSPGADDPVPKFKVPGLNHSGFRV